MKKYFTNYLSFVVFAFFFTKTALPQANHKNDDQTAIKSSTRIMSLEKIKRIENQISAFETKVNWVKNNPAEDSLAKAEGWYDKMNINLEKFRKQIVLVKGEQIQNYYGDILKLPFDTGHIQHKIIPEMINKRVELAPNYPVIEEFIPTSISSVNSLEIWIKEFPKQYENFTSYLEILVINHL